MDLNPLLVFNEPEKDGKRGKLPGGGETVLGPGRRAQAERIFPKIEELERKFAEHIQLTPTPEGLLPEKVLVLEIAGDVQDLARALAQVRGFEFLSNYLLEEVEDETFYTEDKNGNHEPVGRNVYLAMSNQAGLRKLLAMWRAYHKTGKIEDGFAPLKHAFDQLADIRFWDTRDRLENTFLIDDWSERVAEAREDDDPLIPFEIELWFRPSAPYRNSLESHIRETIQKAGGIITLPYVHENIRYHALIGRLPLSKVREVIGSAGPVLELMRCDEVMFFRPLGQCTAPLISTHEEPLPDDSAVPMDEMESDQPVVALLDGYPLSNHTTLQGRLIIDDPDEFESLYVKPSEHIHGTSMASLIIYGDLNDRNQLPVSRPLYVRPIMAPERENMKGHRPEQIPSSCLPVDLIHRAVKRMKEGEEGLPPVAPEVVIINLSVGDRYRLFDRQMSPWARMLDWLSVKYDVLFVVSAGNVGQQLTLAGITERELATIMTMRLEESAIRAIASQRQERRMMSPAEAINVLTVSAAHHDGFIGSVRHHLIDVFPSLGMFSPVNPVTLGRKNAVKPEIHMPGGRQVYANKTLTAAGDVRLSPVSSVQFGPGVKTALPSSNAGALNTYGYTAGTSNATALATRRLAFLYETLQEMKTLGYAQALASAPDAVILKALMVHGAEHNEMARNIISEYLKEAHNSRTFNSDLHQYLGFGRVNETRIHGCRNNQATLLYTGIIRDGESQKYQLPLPASLAATTVNRRLIVTVAWFSPIRYDHQDYRAAQLWAKPEHEKVRADNGDYYHPHLRQGTVFHEVRKGAKAAAYVQGDMLSISVHCYGRAGATNLEVSYALVVTLDAPGTNLPIYQEVRQGLTINTQQRANTENRQ
ncbi:S8 family peptidase [Brenneria tiliae]|uniref:S8 family peptidase n=1 Tax=Brenneria tiliae TaxID=2914984 RepID=A0ABT0MVX6_9GAMM|nr:S8 family peptidase [Brenneria tiliae]MCL2893747.1 S8 family peptidase [Brenneria tiliae]